MYAEYRNLIAPPKQSESMKSLESNMAVQTSFSQLLYVF